jgi:hypothetical protein
MYHKWHYFNLLSMYVQILTFIKLSGFTKIFCELILLSSYYTPNGQKSEWKFYVFFCIHFHFMMMCPLVFLYTIDWYGLIIYLPSLVKLLISCTGISWLSGARKSCANDTSWTLSWSRSEKKVRLGIIILY